MKITTGIAGVASAAALLGTGFTGASAAEASPYIIGGSEAKSPWIVQLNFNSYEQSGTFGCTGEQLNDEWVLTAKHCTDGSYNMEVFQSNDQNNPGEAIRGDRMVAAPEGDIALIHLSKSAPLSQYASLNLDYSIKENTRGDIYGYGMGANKSYTDTLRTARVSVIGESTDAYDGLAVHLRGFNGASNHGDSGGPLVINGKVVAVCSTGDQADPGANINAQSNYAVLAQSADWIESTTGIHYGDGAATPATPVVTKPAAPAKPTTPAKPATPTTPAKPTTPVVDPVGDDWSDDWSDSWSDSSSSSWSNSWSDSWSTSSYDNTGANWNISATPTADGGTHWVSNYHWTR